MKKVFLSVFLSIYCLFVFSQAVYVDSNIGNDDNPGTEEAPVSSVQKAMEIIGSKENDSYIIKVNPGIYVFDKHVSVVTEKPMDGRRIIIEAAVLPDDSLWTPEKMPIIVNSTLKGEIPDEDYSYVVSFLINESHVTIRGMKFHGYFYPNTRYFPVARFNKSKTDLLVEQCMFVGDKDAAHIQVGVIAHGNEIVIDHCVFYNAKNPAVYWQDANDTLKHGNRLTNSIIYGAFQSAVWTAWPDKDFVFENNIVSNCKHVWVKNYFNDFKYTMKNCFLAGNQCFTAMPLENGVGPVDYEITEDNVVRTEHISLRQMETIDTPFPVDYLHVVPDTLGYDLGAGLFKRGK